MADSTFFCEIQEIVEKYIGDKVLSEHDLENPLYDYEIDSLERIKLLLNIEKKYGIAIATKKIWERKITVREFISIIVELKGK